MTDFLIPFLTAMGAGILASWGVGGGTLLLVVMTLFLGVEPSLARAVNLLFFLPTAAAGLWFHRKQGYLDRDVRRQAAPAAVAAALVGALAAGAVDPALLRRPFGVFLLVCGASMVLRRPGGQ